MAKTSQSLESCQKCIGYTFQDPQVLQSALNHASAMDHRGQSNERLEFLGDAVLGLVICQELFERFPKSQEGELTKIKSAVVSRRTCADVADRLTLPRYLRLGKGVESGEQMPRSLAAAVLESVIAAVFIDGGLEAARRFILFAMESELTEAADSEHRFNFKSQLQQCAQRKWNSTPQYELLDEKGPDHSKCFEVAVTIGTQQFPGAWGPSKKEAEQKAAHLALVRMGELPDESEADEQEYVG